MSLPPELPSSPHAHGHGVVSALANHFRSVDSAPAGYSIKRPSSDVNGFMLTFVTLALVSLITLTLLARFGVLERRDLIFASPSPGIVVLPLRLFIVVFFCTYSLYAYTNWRRRAALWAATTGIFILGCLAVDFSALGLASAGLRLSLLAQQAMSLLVAMAALPLVVLAQAQLPGPFSSPVRRQPRAPFVMVAVVLTLSVGIAVGCARLLADPVHSMRSMAILGGIGPGIFLAQQAFTVIFGVIGARSTARTRRSDFAPNLAILVPAHNEAHGIGETIHAVDAAARTYPNHIHMYVVDNCSADDTAEAAARSLERCQLITGEVLTCDIPGKAVALNYGLERIREDFVVRIDADTIIGDDCLAIAMRHFRDPTVGSVGGLPLPVGRTTWIDRVRLVEVILRHGFFQVALGGYQGILGVPGMFAAYRRSVIEEVGGTTEGMNGEDTDICLRMAAAGYRVVADPKAVYYSETPATFEHLREQRTRWFRSIYHIAAHARPILLKPATVPGGIVLPFMLASAARRAMLAPLLVFSVLCLTVFRGAYPHLAWQPVAAVLVGMPMLVAVLAAIVQRRWSVLYLIPAYLCFRLMRSYFTLESLLSLVYPPLRRWPGARGAMKFVQRPAGAR